MELLYFQVKSRRAWACIYTTLGVCLLPFYYVQHCVGRSQIWKQLSTWSFFSSPILSPKKEQGFRFTYFAQDGPVNSPASELNVYITSPGRFEGYLWSPAGNSPTHVVKKVEKEKKARQNLETDLWGIFHLFHQNKKQMFPFRFKFCFVLFCFPNAILVRSCCTYAFWQPLIKEPYVTFLQGLKILAYAGPTNWKVLVESWLRELHKQND